MVDMQWFDDIFLEKGQRDLLKWMVEGELTIPEADRGDFLFVATSGGGFLIHPSLPERPAVNRGDLDTLTEAGLLRKSAGSGGTPRFDITTLGRRYFAEMQRRTLGATDAIEDQVLRFLDAPAFKSAFPRAYDRWHDAEQKVWDVSSTQQLTNIGHACREAMQEFATELLARHPVADVEEDPAKTISRVRAVLNQHLQGGALKAFLEAIIVFWGTVNDLVQRQEHGAQKTGDPLAWEDARRVVFQTAIVMFEIARALR